ncbi:hypothetical protein [Shinella zoogloeoides]|uniref:hypothetical protein n=1 Tax=Shinella zoogloeoides TaxID=352475 RepID=UPI001F58443F|nr:hypothetical protein [Shinella zoogloeoides]
MVDFPERIWATVNGMSTRLPDGGRQLVGGWCEDAMRDRVTEYVRADVVQRIADALYAQVYEHGAVTADAYALIDGFSPRAEENV